MAQATAPNQNKSIRITLKNDERMKLGKELIEKIRTARNSMRTLLDKIDEHNKLYEGNLPAKTFPWDGCANVNVPLMQWVIDTYHSHINEVILGVSPITLIAPMEPGDRDRAQIHEKLLDNMYSSRMHLESVADMLFLYALQFGTAIAKEPWREEYRTVWDEQPIIDEFGQPQIDMSTGEVMTELVEFEEPKYSGPKVEFVDLRNFVIYPTTVPEIESASLVGDKYRLTPDEVRKKIKSGYFDKEPSEELLLRSDNELSQTDEHSSDVQNDFEGLDSQDFEELWFWEVITGYDYNGDGLNEECVVTLESTTGTIVRATRFPYWHGRRYYISFRPFPRPGRFFGRGLCGILEHPQKELNTFMNQWLDSNSLAISKAFKMRKNSELEPDDVQIHPGAVIQLSEPDDLEELVITPISFGPEIFTILRDYAERSSGVNDISMGRETEEQKTAKEVTIVNAEGGIRFGDVVRRLQYSMVEIAQQTSGLMYQFMSDEEVLRMVGSVVNPLKMTNQPGMPGDIPFTRQDLRKTYDYIPHGNTGTANKVQQREEALALYNLVLQSQNPLVLNNMSRLYRFTEDLLTAFDRDDIEAYIGSEDEAVQLQQQQEMMQAHQQMMKQQMAQQQMAMQQEQAQQAQAQQAQAQQFEMMKQQMAMKQMAMQGMLNQQKVHGDLEMQKAKIKQTKAAARSRK